MRFSAGIPYESRASSDQGDRRVAESLEPGQAHDRQQGPDVKAGRGRVEPDIARQFFLLQCFGQALGFVVQEFPPAKFGQKIGVHFPCAPDEASDSRVKREIKKGSPGEEK